MTTETNIEVSHMEGLEAARLFERAIMIAVEQKHLPSVFFLFTKLQGLVLSFLLSSLSSSPEREEYLSILARLDHAISEVISS